MKVYVLFHKGYDEDAVFIGGCYLIGVYASREIAEAVRKSYPHNLFKIEEFEVIE